jgi:hypothetical protein
MKNRKSTIGFFGIGIGAIALLMAIVHFWAGPVTPQPSLEKTVAERAVAIKNATIAALRGEKVEEQAVTHRIDLDQGLRLATGVMGGLAVILGVVGFANRESLRVAGGAVFLGGAAIAFQFVIIALGVVLLAILIVAVLSQIGIE